MMLRAVILALLVSSITAFTASLRPAFTVRSPVVVSPTARFIILSDAETEAILKSATECAESECSVEDVGSLLTELKEQEAILEERLVKIMNIIGHLQHLNEKKERKRDEVRKFVQDMLRVFTHETPGFMPSGWLGEVGDGPTTAYDALPPKPWKSADKK